VWGFSLKSGSYDQVAPSREKWLFLSMEYLRKDHFFLSFFLSFSATIRISPWFFQLRRKPRLFVLQASNAGDGMITTKKTLKSVSSIEEVTKHFHTKAIRGILSTPPG